MFQYQLFHDAAPDVRYIVGLSLSMKRFSYSLADFGETCAINNFRFHLRNPVSLSHT
jgi:hypothetical protein